MQKMAHAGGSLYTVGSINLIDSPSRLAGILRSANAIQTSSCTSLKDAYSRNKPKKTLQHL